eukprot:CAMPEP_0170604020 /NCGR_PEP_ID=MMETSP0224-20130122/19208_1 /TAXON_ID=285029 /ORGANISM="Togula jolla, Strain CCCM 725" /LENGTH=524 /DNA_ID=CAMNT_0010928911 /DNA_START=73 /DNA_END=1647 /DNA_ORIENTATION=+
MAQCKALIAFSLLFGLTSALPDVNTTGTINVGILIMPGVFISEATIPFEMFKQRNTMNVYFVASTMDPVYTYYGARLKPDYIFSDAPAVHLLVVPSGIGSHHSFLTSWYGGETKADTTIQGKTANDQPVTYYGNMTDLIEWVRTSAASAQIVTSHCWGAFTLADAGVLDGKAATTFPGYTATLEANYPSIGSVVADKRWVTDGNVMTSNGGLAAFEASLAVIRHLYGEEEAAAVASDLVLSEENVGHSLDEYFRPSPVREGEIETISATKVGILLLEGTFISDPTAPFDIFAHLGAAVDVYFVGETMEPIQTYYGATMYPDYTIADAPQPDIIAVPGGNSSLTSDREKADVVAWIRNSAVNAAWVTSHGLGTFMLCEAGLCDNKALTTSPGSFTLLKDAFPAIAIATVGEDRRIVKDGNLVTSSGWVAAYEAANYVIMKHFGENAAKNVATGLVFAADNYQAMVDAYDVEAVTTSNAGVTTSNAGATTSNTVVTTASPEASNAAKSAAFIVSHLMPILLIAALA